MDPNRYLKTALRPPAGTALGRILRNSAINAAGVGSTMLLNFAAIFILARRLGTERVGIYFLIFTIAVVVHFVFETGVGTVVTRRIAQSPRDLRKHVREAMGLLLIISLLSFLTLVAIGAIWSIWANKPIMVTAFLLAGIGCAGRQVQEFCAGVFRGLENFTYENIARVGQVGIFAVCVYIFVRRGTGIWVAIALFAISNLIAAVWMLGVMHWRYRCLGLRMNRAILRDWCSESLPLGFGDLVRRLTWQIDTILLGFMATPAAVGIYSIAYRPLQPLQLLPRMVLSVTFPAFSRLAGDNRDALRKAFARSVRLLWIISLPITICICVYAEPLITIPAGDEYLPAANLLRVLIWIACLTFLSAQFRFLFAALSNQRIYTKMVLAVFAIELVLEAALIPLFGYYGACAGSLTGEIIFVIIGFAACRKLDIAAFEWGAMFRVVPAAILLALGLWLVRDAWWPLLIVACGVGTAAYFVLCALFGAVQRDELARIRSMILGGGARRREGRAFAVLPAESLMPAAAVPHAAEAVAREAG